MESGEYKVRTNKTDSLSSDSFTLFVFLIYHQTLVCVVRAGISETKDFIWSGFVN